MMNEDSLPVFVVKVQHGSQAAVYLVRDLKESVPFGSETWLSATYIGEDWLQGNEIYFRREHIISVAKFKNTAEYEAAAAKGKVAQK